MYSAARVADGSEVAVKITDLRRSQKGGHDNVDGERKRVAENEVAILKRLGARPYCVAFHEGFVEGHSAYIVMEKCDTTLKQTLKRTLEPSHDAVAGMVKDLLQALRAIHTAGVVHRDIKPDNILCCGDPLEGPECRSLKLCDFGHAAVLPGDGGMLRGVFGTPPFMSPEMLGRQGHNAKTDVWSLGVVTYIFLLGELPYQPPEGTIEAIKSAILTNTPYPTFKPAVDSGRPKLRDGALPFLCALLNRSTKMRPSAEVALRYHWVAVLDKNSEEWRLPSVLPRAPELDVHTLNDIRQGGADAAPPCSSSLSVGAKTNAAYMEAHSKASWASCRSEEQLGSTTEASRVSFRSDTWISIDS